MQPHTGRAAPHHGAPCAPFLCGLEVSEVSHRHVNKRTGVVIGAAAAAVMGAAILLPNANASTDRPPAPRTFSASAATRLATALKSDLGADNAGWYLDGANGHLVMNVLSQDAA